MENVTCSDFEGGWLFECRTVVLNRSCTTAGRPPAYCSSRPKHRAVRGSGAVVVSRLARASGSNLAYSELSDGANLNEPPCKSEWVWFCWMCL